MRDKKGFTLIEILAVIVILGLLMAIAIPNVTRYITQSKKKTLTATVVNYVNSLVAEVNNMEYDFEDTDLIVLEAESEGVPGDGVETCTLYNKGNNYDQVEQDKIDRLPSLPTLILKHNEVIKDKPTLTDSSNNTSDKSGLYSSNVTTNDKVTYYFRGDVKNNYVKFANLTWKIIRINEDGSVRLMLNDRVGGTAHVFKNAAVTFEDMYYSYGSNAKAQVDNWYATTIANTKYDKYVVNGIFCEQAKAKISESLTSGNADMIYFKNYEPNFDCDLDGNGRGLLLNADGSRAKVGLITYDEMIHAGGYYNKENQNYYLYNGSYGIWSMSPGGFSSTAYLWMMRTQGILIDRHVKYGYNLQPVINIKGDLKAKGTGLFDDPYILLTN